MYKKTLSCGLLVRQNKIECHHVVGIFVGLKDQYKKINNPLQKDKLQLFTC